MFAITDCNGFHLIFPNNITLLTQFGYGAYCGYHDIHVGLGMQIKLQSQDAEIAIWDEDGVWLTKQAYKETFGKDIGAGVEGGVEIEEWLEIVDWCREYKQEKVIKGESEE